MANDKNTATILTAWKIFAWTVIGQAVVLASQQLPLLELGPKLQWIVPFIGMALSIIGKTIATYVETGRQEG